ncbi:response regulator [bacterium]|nr:response regulator [bacterium]
MKKEKKRILIIDDEEDFCKLIKKNLELRGDYEVGMSTDAKRGIEFAKEVNPDLILIDIVMPDIDGSQVAFELKNDSRTKDIPIVFLTGLATKEETNNEGGIIGGHPFLAKPVETEELIDCIENILVR